MKKFLLVIIFLITNYSYLYSESNVNPIIEGNVDAKIHYPVPMHLQPAAKFLKYKKGDFPVAENLCKTTLSLPVHEFISKKDVDKMIKLINAFYKN